MRFRFVLGLAVVSVVFAVRLGEAQARACPVGAVCGRISVPIDHRGRVTGTLSLAYSRLPATQRRRGTVVLLPGGPGQAAIPLTGDIARILRALRATQDLLF